MEVERLKKELELLQSKYNKLYETIQNILINLEDRGISVYTRERGKSTQIFSTNYLSTNTLYKYSVQNLLVRW